MVSPAPSHRQRRLGQNFVADPNLLDAIVRDSGMADTDVVLEFGAGAGALSERLAAGAAHLHTVEIDRGLEAELEGLALRPDVSLHWADAVKLDLGRVLDQHRRRAVGAASGRSPKPLGDLELNHHRPAIDPGQLLDRAQDQPRCDRVGQVGDDDRRRRVQ